LRNTLLKVNVWVACSVGAAGGPAFIAGAVDGAFPPAAGRLRHKRIRV